MRTIPVFVVSVLLILSCSNQESSVKTSGLVDSTARPDTELKGTSINLYDRGRVTSKIEAQRIVKFDVKDSTMGYQINSVFYDTTGRMTSSVVGDSAVIKEKIERQSIYGNVKINTYDANGKVSVTITGDSSVVSGNNNHMFIYSRVVAITQTNSKLETDSLHWNPDVDSIQTDAFVKFTRGADDVLTGWGLRADRDLRKIRILREVSGTIKQTDSMGKP
jgi:lipopolysaccharide export system protein LptC